MPIESSSFPSIIGPNGDARSGKDTVAAMLVAEYGYRQVAFADRLKNFVAALFPSVAEIVNAVGWEEAKNDVDVRRTLQGVGVAARLHIGEHVWIDAALASMQPDERIVVSDVRFVNEADSVLSRGSAVFRIERPGVKPADGHISETALDRFDRFDALILNDDTIEVLHERARFAIDEWSPVKVGVR